MAIKDKRTEIQEEEIQDIELAVAKKTKFRINGDNNCIIELNTSDLGIAGRLSDAYPKLLDYVKDAQKQVDAISEADEDSLGKFADMLRDIDKKMRDLVDYIFNSPVADKCAKDGTMYDPYEGEFRFEVIISKLVKLYSNNLDTEFAKMKDKVSKHTNKYTKKYHK